MREFSYVFSAVCPQQGALTSLILPRADTEMMSLFLNHLSQQYPDQFLVVVLDQAGWHKARALSVPENIRLLSLPPYSPELNPVEHVWDDLREKDLGNHAFQTLDQVEDHLCLGLNRLVGQPDTLRSLTNFPYLHVTV